MKRERERERERKRDRERDREGEEEWNIDGAILKVRCIYLNHH